MWLSTIGDDAAKFAGVISKTLDVDVIIVAANLKIIANTYRYFDRYDIIRPASVVGQVISHGKVIAFEDKRTFEKCLICPDFRTCEMAGFVGVPIFYQGTVAGAIALILPKVKVAQIFRNIRNSIAFLENMSNQLSSKLKDREEYSALAILKQEREVFMDEVQDALAFTNSAGYLAYYNRRFMECFDIDKSSLGHMITALVPHPKIEQFVKTKNSPQIRDSLILVRRSNCNFFGLVSCRTIETHENAEGMLFTFRSIHQVGTDFTVAANPESELTFEQCEDLFSRSTIESARRFAGNDKTALIYYMPQQAEILLARCIHNHSNRRDRAFITVDAADIRGFEEKLLFGTPGRLPLAHNGTFFLRNIEYLSSAAQMQLTYFLKTVPNDRLDVRFIFSSSVNLKRQAESAGFSGELYQYLSGNVIHTKEPAAKQPLTQVQTISELERENIKALLRGNYSKDQMAQILGISRATLYRRIKEYEL